MKIEALNVPPRRESELKNSKWRWLLAVAWCLLAMCPAFGQEEEHRVTLNLKEATLGAFVDEVSEQTGLAVFYKDDVAGVVEPITVSVTDVPLREVLQKVVRTKGCTFAFEGNTVVIRKQTQQEVMVEANIRGIVTDSKGEPLPGVTVLVKEMNIGTATDTDGRYRLTVPVMDDGKFTLAFSFVGYETREEVYTGQDSINVVLMETTQKMNEVVVTGYGNISKGNYTGAATTMQAEEVLMAGVSSIDQMLQGVVPGMLVMNQTGMVGATPKIRVRGTSTLLGSQEPVWVVDGVIQRDPQPFNSEENTKFSVDADDIKELAGNAISWLNPNDIESITVLKDASATAIYGSQAANGVIVITTKKAQPGKIQINYNGDFSIGQRPRYGLYDRMNSAEYMEFSKEIYDERASYPSEILPIGYAGLVQQLINKEITVEELNEEYQKMARENTDWFDLLFRNSFNHSHNLSFSGGSEVLQNRTSFGFTQNKGEAKGNDETLFTATSNTTLNIGKVLQINMLLKGSWRKVSGFAYGVDPFTYAYNTSRAIPMYNEDGSYYYHEKEGNSSDAIEGKNRYNFNIQNELDQTHSENVTRSWGMTFDLSWKILPDLEYQGLFSWNSSSADTKQYATERSFYVTSLRGYEYGSVSVNGPEVISTPLPNGGILETDLSNVTIITTRNSLVYNHLFDNKHQVTLQAGVETNSTKTKGNSATRYGYLHDRGETFAIPPASYVEYGGDYEYDNSEYVNGSASVVNRIENLFSTYGSAVYTYDDRYVLNVSGRYDASNRFGQDKNKRFEPTWSAGVKWRVTNESFARGKWWLNNLDIYGSYGYQGNSVESVSPYLIAFDGGMLGIGNYYQSYVLRISSLPYPNLGWEKTETWNVGIDASLLNGRLNFTANYYKKISDVLSSRDVPNENGVENAVVSGSTMENTGYDLVINVVPIRLKDFSWQLSLNTAVSKNEVTKNERVNTLEDYLEGASVVNGEPNSTFYSYEFAGLNPENGTPLFENMDIEGAEGPIDYLVKSGKFTPDFSGGLNTQFKYKHWSLYALFAMQWGGHDRLPSLYPAASVYGGGLPTPEQNVSRKLKGRWKQPGDEVKTNIPSLPGIGETQAYLPTTETSYQSMINPYYQYDLSDERVANTDFIRCRSISLSYEFGENWLKPIGAKYLLLKASMTNPFMWVSDDKWEGLDPETGDWPARRVTTFSIQVTF